MDFMYYNVFLVALLHLCARSGQVYGCSVQPGTPTDSGGSCSFNHDIKCGYTFNGYWKTHSGRYSYIGHTIPGHQTSGSKDAYYAVNYPKTHVNNDKTLFSSQINPGNYCLSFWYYKTGGSSILSVSVQSIDGNTHTPIWNAKDAVSHHWTQLTSNFSQSKQFQIVFSSDIPGLFDQNFVAIDNILLSPEPLHTLKYTSSTEELMPSTGIVLQSVQGQLLSQRPTVALESLQSVLITETLSGNLQLASFTSSSTSSPIYKAETDALSREPVVLDSITTIVQSKHSMTSAQVNTELQTPVLVSIGSTDTFWNAKIQPSQSSKATEALSVTSPFIAEQMLLWQSTPTALSRAMSTAHFTSPADTALSSSNAIQSSSLKMAGTPPASIYSTTSPLIPTVTSFYSSAMASEIAATPTLLYMPTVLPAITDSLTQNTTMSSIQRLQQSHAIQVSCGQNMWNISVDMATMSHLYPGIGEGDVYLGNSGCKGVSTKHTIRFQQQLQNCSSKEMITDTSINFRNKLVYAEHDPMFPFIIRRHVWELTVECDVPLETEYHTHIHHGELHLPDTVITPPPDQSVISLGFYRDSSFQHEIPGPPLHVSLGDAVYVNVFTVTQVSNLKLFLQFCYVKPNVGASGTLQYYLIKDGCVTDPNTHIISYTPQEIRFVFKEIEFSSNPEGLEIYCKASLCGLLDYSPRCSPTCSTAHLIG